ncbi:hypothetical protein CEXT_60351 [Caerostris extrusa]|uniref:Uncharacterized protein n=1 Tax=Caerostris extrusa TaxID=172846 RepID=A0AAV4XNZ9_CAEEX|nr:hypothetical protein CEXT_60351 [Caerostris extrusa]
MIFLPSGVDSYIDVCAGRPTDLYWENPICCACQSRFVPAVSRNDAKRIVVTLRSAKEGSRSCVYVCAGRPTDLYWENPICEPARVVSRNDAKRIAVTLRRAKEGSHPCM